MPTALVTGATGLVGMHLVPRLQREGWRVRALVRDAARAGLLSRADVTLATGDVLEPTGFERAARGCDVVFHAAAVITPRGGWEAYRRPNVEGTRNAIAAATSAKARLVHVSSVAVYGDNDRYAADGRKTDESAPLGRIPETSFYARSKRESEELVFEAQRTGALWATAVRPWVHVRAVRPAVHSAPRAYAAARIRPRHRGRAQHTRDRARGQRRRRNGARGAARCGEWPRVQSGERLRHHGARLLRARGRGDGKRLRIVSVPLVVARAAFGAFRTLAPMIVGERFNVAANASLNFLARDNPFSSELARREWAGLRPCIPRKVSWRRSAGGRRTIKRGCGDVRMRCAEMRSGATHRVCRPALHTLGEDYGFFFAAASLPILAAVSAFFAAVSILAAASPSSWTWSPSSCRCQPGQRQEPGPSPERRYPPSGSPSCCRQQRRAQRRQGPGASCESPEMGRGNDTRWSAHASGARLAA